MEVKNNHTCCEAATTAFLRKFKMPATIDPMIPGRAATALPASLPRSLARALSFPFIHSLSLFGCFGGLAVAAPSPPVKKPMIVETTSPREVSTAVIVKPCSLNISLIFSQRVKSSSRIFSTVCRILANCDASSFLF